MLTPAAYTVKFDCTEKISWSLSKKEAQIRNSVAVFLTDLGTDFAGNQMTFGIVRSSLIVVSTSQSRLVAGFAPRPGQ